MADKRSLRLWRNGYARLLRLYPRPYHERFGEGMEQTFGDVLRERAREGRGVSARALWMFVETSVGIVRENMTMKKNKNIIRIALVTAFILLIPLVAMQFSDEVDWNLFDFVVAGALLFGSGLAYELVARKRGNVAYRAAVGVAVAAALLLVWINLAVGIIGSEDNPVNGLYFLVVFIGIIGVGIARFRPRGMAWALFATALAQLLVPMIALLIGKSQASALQDPPGFVGVLVLNAFFAMLFVMSALLFLRSVAAPKTEPRA
jgi:hypothetical protein